jgi:cobalamin biosynthetic protein CobC
LLEHGGKILAASRKYGIAPEHWLDLSTGVSPFSYPVKDIPQSAWHYLPQTDDGLEDAAKNYYQCEQLLATAGSQPIIQTLPKLRQTSRVVILQNTYREHPYAWNREGHILVQVSGEHIEDHLDSADVVVLCNPNNPSGEKFSTQKLLHWADMLAQRGGWLVVDEAFADTNPEISLARYGGRPGLVVLRSVGKFFGLAGARVGFLIAPPELLMVMAESLGPWTVAGASRSVLKQALMDSDWQKEATAQLKASTNVLKTVLQQNALEPTGSTDFFHWVKTPAAQQIHELLAAKAILTRFFEAPASIRFGLPPNQKALERLQNALANLPADCKQSSLSSSLS